MTTPLVSTADHAEGRIRVITLDNHAKRNKLDIAMCDAIESAMLAAVEDGARVVLLHGDGTVFSAGADLSGDVYAGGFYPRLLRMLGTIQTLPIPVVAWVNGPAIGAGTQLSMACDLRVVHDTALFRVPIVDVAIALDEVTIRTLEHLVGGSVARAMLLTGAALSAEDAVRSGYAVRAGGFDDALSVAELIASKAPLTLRHLKYEFAHTSHAPYSDEQRREVAAAAWHSQDVEESRAARAEKRAPHFQGR
ncbi:enoyl-CoA hydratase [Corynebacterium sp.]|uniref:enoyl-CoA hydratase n=1 Tax=Corynebacterium sp. TaxID=1720 RepID=UPI0026E0EE8C|nr:enoyl-CoA hydratase [Corynebacterium sp.]MDO5511963.1 enoyl-CoA hydratase [Corynebacterium sp.]